MQLQRTPLPRLTKGLAQLQAACPSPRVCLGVQQHPLTPTSTIQLPLGGAGHYLWEELGITYGRSWHHPQEELGITYGRSWHHPREELGITYGRSWHHLWEKLASLMGGVGFTYGRSWHHP